MSEDEYTEVTNQSWFGRIGGAFKGILVGIILVIIAFPVLFWNEGRAVKRYKTLEEGAGAVISVSANAIAAENNGKLVHISDIADTENVLTDSEFGVSVKALKLKRVVEMYQWKESSSSKTKKKIGGGTETVKTYSYSKTWSDNKIDSSSFKKSATHTNPRSFPYSSRQYTASEISVGAFTLSKSLVNKIGGYQDFPVNKIPPLLDGKVQQIDSGFYIGANPASPQIGDVRIMFKVVKPKEVSVMAMQAKNTFEPYATSVGGVIDLLESGKLSAAQMIQQQQDNNKVLSWVLRLVGFVLMFIGFNLIFRPLSVLADVLPILGSVVGVGTGLVSFLSSIVLSALTIAVAWVFYRPLVAVILIAVIVGAIIVLKLKMKKNHGVS
ncbi:MAG: hypothetical protein D6B27_00710 [Gammaproteobacteria bacterium]|nr:MAG: hypothetical protein D6B27_00710 [Gammaproteobacteria bacterium]